MTQASRYAEAIDSVLADEFLTSAVTRAVVAVAYEEQAELRAELAAARPDYAELMSYVRSQEPLLRAVKTVHS